MPIYIPSILLLRLTYFHARFSWCFILLPFHLSTWLSEPNTLQTLVIVCSGKWKEVGKTKANIKQKSFASGFSWKTMKIKERKITIRFIIYIESSWWNQFRVFWKRIKGWNWNYFELCKNCWMKQFVHLSGFNRSSHRFWTSQFNF